MKPNTQSWTVVVTRPIGHSQGLINLLGDRGFHVVHIPCIGFEVLPLSEDSREMVRGSLIGEFDWIVFTSQEAVCAYADLVKEATGSISLPSMVRVAVQGPATAEALRDLFQREPTAQPDIYTAEELGKMLVRIGVVGSEILIPGSEQSRRTVANIVERDGASVTILHTYRSVPIEPSEAMRIRLASLDPVRTIVTFFSPSAFHAWREISPEGLRSVVRNAVVGPVTGKVVEEAGDKVAIEADPHTDEGMVAALIQFTQGKLP